MAAAVSAALEFAASKGVDPKTVIEAEGFARQARIQEAAETLLGSEEDIRQFLQYANAVWRLFKAVMPDPAALEHRWNAVVFQVIAETIRSMTKAKGRDISEVLAEIERLVDSAISGAAIRAPIPTGNELNKLFDLSSIDFEKLADLFASGSKKTATEILKGKVEERVNDLATRNPTQIGLLEKLQNLIDQYNTGSLEVERLFEELMNFTRDLDVEETRHIREGLSEEELPLFDILTKPEPKLTKAQELEVKKIAKALLIKLKREKLILDWRIKETAKAAVRETIREEYDQLPEVYERKMWDEKIERTFQFVFEHYAATV